MSTSRRILILFAVGLNAVLSADELQLERFAYPYPVQTFKFKSQQRELEMAYMDLKPERASGAIVLLHGKNFSGAYWEETAKNLRAAGFRVIMPDQVGFAPLRDILAIGSVNSRGYERARVD